MLERETTSIGNVFFQRFGEFMPQSDPLASIYDPCRSIESVIVLKTVVVV